MSTPERPVAQSRPSALDGQVSNYDHAIALVDSTKPDDTPEGGSSRSESPGWRKITREATRGSVRESIKRRKYAKWSQERFDSQARDNAQAGRSDDVPEVENRQVNRPQATQHDSSEVVDFAHSEEGLTEAPRHTRKKNAKLKKEQDSVIDILYENQRGWFFCGIPLYSHSSLLQFDPAPWVTKDYKESAVNITNAQVPDPSWQWDWKHWYVDMGDDVDEDGWQYSFAFFGKFAWHGTHPWFHSYVRRRRWLRRRVKKASAASGQSKPSSMSVAHHLNADYFTIHSKAVGNTSDEMSQIVRPESYTSQRNSKNLEEDIPEDLHDIASLLKSMRMSSIDREKIDAMKHFIDIGGEELYYLREHIPEIMSRLVFQNSKRQLLELLRQKADEAQKHRDEHAAKSRPEGEAEARRIDNLLKAAQAADEQIDGLEYWSDRKHILLAREDTKGAQDITLETIFDKSTKSPKMGSTSTDEMQGIPKEAEIGQDPTEQVVHDIHDQDQADEEAGKEKDKAKERAREEDDAATEDLPPRLQQDQVFIPDEQT